MAFWTATHREWNGTAADLAREVVALAGNRALHGDGIRSSERLVRHYTQLGILRRPQRRGREARYGFRQLAEFVAARHLVEEGWPLAKIAEFMTVSDLPQILDLIPGSALRPGDGDTRMPETGRQAGGAAAALDASFGRLRDRGRLRQELGESEQAAYGDPAEALVRLQLVPWCHAYVSLDALRGAPVESLEPLGRALVQAILDARLAHGART